MLKKLVAFALGAGVSLSASAGYVQYELKDVKFNDGGQVTGSFIQNTDSKAIAYYEMRSGGAGFGNQYFISDIYANLLSAYTYFSDAGPTSFASYVNTDDMGWVTLSLDFTWSPQAGQYRVGGTEAGPKFDGWVSQWKERSITGGTLVETAVDPVTLAGLESEFPPGIKYVIPTLRQVPAGVPEPASLALFAAGMCGLVGLGRRARRTRRA